MKAAILFPGQGAQYFGMGKDLYDNDSIVKNIYDQAEAILDWQLTDLCFGTPNELIHQTRYTQAALFVTNYAVYKVLEERGLKADALLGFSLGEYDAIAASGALDFESTLKLVEKRGIYMDECAKAYPGGMSAVLGGEVSQITKICEAVKEETGAHVSVANDNCPGQVTIAGEEKALALAKERLTEMGVKRVVPLKVSGAFHSPLMEEASKKLTQQLDQFTFSKSTVPVISNVTAQAIEGREIPYYIPLQITHGVRFRESILNLIDQGFDTFIEVGPKTTLSRLVKQIDKNVEVYQAEDSETIKNLMEKVGN